ncbi:SDR family oxidoreductase [Nocardioides sp. zg-536]|uniref:SDR family oxidoreductase n=1 Tax=Nocardioides faecalis TaxID=2803858 RepID=A0A938XYU0_9ACTN|nr:SDR family oxidoreductase [Nocardioides faecalis]MBM9458987.1 SDR family oxidoreductase [Nocardioides faecalis]MBS4753911.1 SDR family oxidoreductase [Nocardioides faecalis]QVI57256.1 SDR family oxidoreductase [Nocardioides faecalis]
MDLDLRERAYVLTGATRGLGRATATALLADGARVVLSGRTAEAVDAAVAELGARYGADNVAGVACDNADPATPGRLIATAQERWGRLDGALISVGGPPAGATTAITDAQWTAAFESVFLGGVRLAREIGTSLTSGGSLAFVLSTSVRQPIAGLAVSNGLRPGLAMVAKTLADELGPSGVRVNALLPGRVGTDRVAELDDATGDAEAARRTWEEQIPLRRYGAPEEFGKVAAFLLSPASSFVSGAMVPVDGGMSRAL